jgi:predicted metal-dependent HD superfamily phosphohydrolase
VPDEQFLAGRLAVLTELSDREIFRTTKGRQLSDAARANLSAEINALSVQLARSARRDVR